MKKGGHKFWKPTKGTGKIQREEKDVNITLKIKNKEKTKITQ